MLVFLGTGSTATPIWGPCKAEVGSGTWVVGKRVGGKWAVRKREVRSEWVKPLGMPGNWVGVAILERDYPTRGGL